jgi:TPR repeat protein
MHDPLIAYELARGNFDVSLIKIAQGDALDDGANFSTVFEQFKHAAENGSPFAMCVCSRMCCSGKGTIKSQKCAYEWANRAAQTSYAPGLFELGQCYENGIGVVRDIKRAAQLYETSSNAGFGYAAYCLGLMFDDDGLGEKNYEYALHWFGNADALGEHTATYEIAQWYEHGEKVKNDNALAVRMYEKASAMGSFFASYRLSAAYASGEIGLETSNSMSLMYEKRMQSQLKMTSP